MRVTVGAELTNLQCVDTSNHADGNPGDWGIRGRNSDDEVYQVNDRCRENLGGEH